MFKLPFFPAIKRRAGRNAATIMKRALPAITPRTVFDVGANVGQSTQDYLKLFPLAHIHAFEPVPATFEALSASLQSHRTRVSLHQVALSDSAGTVAMRARGVSVSNAILRDGETARQAIEVRTLRGDTMASALAIEVIDFLKIDAEGHDLKVLEGFSGLLEGGAIRLIQVEAGFNPDNAYHVQFETFCHFLARYDYRVLQIMNQVWERDRPALRRGNVLFMRS